MFSSIRHKLLFYMTINIVIFAAVMYFGYDRFAKGYYLEKKKGVLVENSNRIKDIIKDRDISTIIYDNDIIYQINRLEMNMGGVIVIGKLDGTIYYPSVQDSNQPPRRENKENPFFTIDKNSIVSIKPVEEKQDPMNQVRPPNDLNLWETYDDESFFIKLQDPNFKIRTLRFQTNLGNGLTLLLWVPMDEIFETVKMTNTFTVIISLITIFITGIWSFFISKTFTSPITEMNVIAKKMSEFDFSETLKITGKDEITQLSESINHLSQKLNTTMSELNTKNQELEQDIDRERKLDQMRKEFVANVSHELKTPIFLIQGYAEGLKTNIARDEEKRNFYCDVIMEESDKMDTLVRDLLELSEMESGMFSIKRVDFDIVVLITDIIDKLETVLKERAINLEMHIPKHLIVNADPVRIEQIMINFLNNAINHIDNNKKIRITIKQDNKKVKVLVYNTGKGISNDSSDKIWTSFYKVDKARTREYGGTGLGLSIVKAIQEAHQNEYGVCNIEEGVEFWFNIDLG